MSDTLSNLKTAHAHLSELDDLLEGGRGFGGGHSHGLVTSAMDLVSASIQDLEQPHREHYETCNRCRECAMEEDPDDMKT